MVHTRLRNLLIVALIPEEYWSFPPWVDPATAKKHMQEMEQRNILYGGSESYRHMCRFNSGFFYRLEAMQKYDFYWRVEPCNIPITRAKLISLVTEYYCDLYYDPFTFMRENNLKYGWVMSLFEFGETIPTLWQTVRSFVAKHPKYVAKDNSINFLVDDPAKGINGEYNLCHVCHLLFTNLTL